MKYSLLSFLAGAFFGCTSNSIMPLTVGNNWHYRWAHFNSFGDTLKKQENYVLVIEDTIIDNQHWSQIRKNYGDTIFTKSYAMNRSDGLYKFFRLAETQSLDLPYPAAVGATAVRRDTINPETIMVDSVYVQSTNQSVTVPAGIFNSYLYHRTHIYTNTINSEIQSHTVTSDEYYAPGVGFVKGLYYGTSKTEGKPNEEVLIDYKVK